MEKIKVCQIITKMVYGGASLGTLHLAEHLNPKYFQSFIICGSQSKDEGDLLSDIKNKDLKVIVIPELVREVNLIRDFAAFMRVITLMKKYNFKIIHTHGSKAGVVGRLAAAYCRVPVILHTVHGWGLKAGQFLEKSIFRLIEKMLAKFTTKILFQTKADKNEAEQYKIGKQNQYILIGNGINLVPFFKHNKKIAQQVRSELALKNQKIVGTVGRVSAQKNPKGFVDIAQAVLRKKRDVSFVFIGGGDMLEEMRNLINNIHMGTNINFMGVRENIPEVVANFDIFILTSLWEGMPRSVIEAMALSKPVVAYKIDGIEEVIADSVNGVIVPLNQTKIFAEKIGYLLDNPRLCRKLGKHGKTMSKNYDFNEVIVKTETLYHRLIVKAIL